jgi:hypothetical protein
LDRGKKMRGEDLGLDGYVTASAKQLRLAIEPDSKAGVIANLEVIFKIAGLVDGFVLPDDAEPAPVFEA